MTTLDKLVKRYAIGLLWFACGACAEPAPQDSSSSHWLECEHDRECLRVSQGAGCSNGACVTAQGERVKVAGEAELGTSGGGREDVTCNPLEPVQHASEPGEFIALLRAADGVTYLVDRAASSLRVFASEGATLVPQQVTGSGEGSGQIQLSVRSGAGSFTLLLKPEDDPHDATRIDGELGTKDADLSAGEQLEVLPERGLREFTLAPLVSIVRIEHHARAATGEHVLVVVPERDFAYENFRLFYGEDEALVERRIHNVVRTKSGSTSIEFLVDGEGVEVSFPARLEVDESNGETLFIEDPAQLARGDESLELPLLPKTAEAVGDRSSSCFAQLPNGWTLAANGPGKSPTSCPQALALDACIDSPRPVALADGGLTTFTGTVTQAGSGYPENGACTVQAGRFNSGFGSAVSNANAADATWFVLLTDTGEEALVSLTARGFDARRMIGRIIELQVALEPGGFGPTLAHLEIRGTGNETPTLFWLGEAGTIEELSGPLTLSRSDAECEQSSDCISKWYRYSLEVDPRETVAGPNVEVPYGTQVNTKNWVISNGGVDLQAADATTCDDAFVSLARVAIWPQPFETCVPLTTDNCNICESSYDKAVTAVEQACDAVRGTENEVFNSGFSALNCGLHVVQFGGGAGSPTYAFYDLDTNELVGWSNLNQPEACQGSVPKDETCYGEDANFSSQTDLCSPQSGVDAGAPGDAGAER